MRSCATPGVPRSSISAKSAPEDMWPEWKALQCCSIECSVLVTTGCSISSFKGLLCVRSTCFVLVQDELAFLDRTLRLCHFLGRSEGDRGFLSKSFFNQFCDLFNSLDLKVAISLICSAPQTHSHESPGATHLPATLTAAPTS